MVRSYAPVLYHEYIRNFVKKDRFRQFNQQITNYYTDSVLWIVGQQQQSSKRQLGDPNEELLAIHSSG